MIPLDPVPAGRLFTYTVTVTNNGPAAATGETLTDTLPAGLTIISIVTSQGTFTQSGDIITCNLGSMASGATATLTITARRFTPDPITITNTASVTANESDPNTANNTASETTSVIPQ
ncbi:MAG: DUF11 domain-containing protein [Pyrinomonadaceae bacterium]|nr:DUF11 domain-containing protein [Pyrinomonadaceae bacterium]